VLLCTSCGRQNPDDARFCAGCGTPLEAVAAPRREVRKTVTIVFSDVTGSTSMGEQLDPETTRRVMGRYFEEMRAVIERHGGTVEKFIGDAVMAVFGIPTLHEDDALRAVRAASEMRERLAAVNAELRQAYDVEIRVRTGLNTGEVVAGEGQTLATGDTVNVAARLEQAAAPGEILLGDATYALVRDAVAAAPVEPLALKGKSEGVPAHRLLDVHPDTLGHVRRLDSPLVGREREQALLRQAFERAVDDRACHLFTVLGSAGVGKSRLVDEFVGAVESSATLLRGRCLSYGEGITFWPLVEAVKTAAGLGGNETVEQARAALETLVAGEAEADVVAHRIGQLVGLAEGSAGQEESFWAVRRLLETLARRRPLVVVFDDLHWAEPTFLDLIEHVSDWSRDAPILLVCASRPELLDLRPAWAGGKLNATSVLLEPLDAEACGRLVENLLGGIELDEEAGARVLAAAEGNPLFIEELLAMLVDDGLIRRDNRRWKATAELRSLPVPPTIHALVAARIDKLGEAEREVMERASVEGKVFHLGAVRELSGDGAAGGVEAEVMTLVRKELIRPDRSTFGGEDAFRFRHLLIRDAAYLGLPKEARADLHERFARWLEGKIGERAVEYDEIVGYHLEQAFRYREELAPADETALGLAGEAGEKLASAGRRALVRGDVSAAANLLARAVSLLPGADSERLALMLELAEALYTTGDLVGARSVLSEALHAALDAGDTRLEAHALIDGLLLQTLTDPDFKAEELLVAADGAIDRLERLGDHLGLAKAWRAVAEVELTRCRWGASAAALERALAYGREAGREPAETYTNLATSLYYGPTPVDEGMRRCREIREQAGGRRIVEAGVTCYLAGFQAMLGDVDGARRLFDQSRRTYQELGHKFGVAGCSVVAGASELAGGDAEAAERELRIGLELFEAMGETGVLSTLAAFLAEALYRQGRDGEAEELALLSERVASEDDAASQIAWRSTLAKVLTRRGDAGRGESLARQAVRIAEETDFLSMKADVRLSLAETLTLAGRPDEDTAEAVREALALYEQKGNRAGAARAEALLGERGAVGAVARPDGGHEGV
jgi:class 3 adenylate cyclase